LGSVHQAGQRSIGAAMFPASLLLCAIFYWPIDPLIFQGAALILGLSDGLAGLIGQRFGRRSYAITGPKTIEGSLAFFIITTLILTLFTLHDQNFNLFHFLAIIIAALLITVAEGIASKGWDNLPVALLGGLSIYILVTIHLGSD
jgi:phytol kinase